MQQSGNWSPRMSCHLVFMSEYTTDISNDVKGEHKAVVDALSRALPLLSAVSAIHQVLPLDYNAISTTKTARLEEGWYWWEESCSERTIRRNGREEAGGGSG
ncbi:hypothetical protein Pmani_016978 [Petrolisthes manimaculis]|uniref:Uncharacterized protein n=1 Tax=Petrolisthes manimaculis TaxID=1843537 RepID=A0AAE1U9W6_9EUCA|nr:hypothetical protein Pmani_016978 [Petrolisthes manimaculis]